MIIFLGLIYVLIQIPSVQTFITKKVTDQLSTQLGTEVSIEGVDIDFFKKIVVEGVYLEDQQQDTLLYAEKLRADIGVFALFGKEIVLDEILLENAYINIYTIDDSATFNFAFIPEAFADTTQQDTTQAGWAFDLRDIILSDIRFDFNDFTTEMKMDMAVERFTVALETLGLEESHIQIDAIEVDALQFRFLQLAQASANTDTTVSDPNESATDAPLNPTGFKYSIDKFLVENSNIAFITDTTRSEQINFGNLDLNNLFINIQGIIVGENSAVVDIENVAFVEANSGFRLEELAIELGVKMPAFKAKLTALETGNSALNGEVAVVLPNINYPDSLLNMLFLTAELDSTRIGLEDATYFSAALDTFPAFKDMDLKIKGVAKIDSGNAMVKDLELTAGTGANLQADAVVKGLADLPNAYLDVNVKSFISNMGFISAFLPPNTLPPSLKQAGGISIMARAEGYLDDADLVASVKSEIGRIAANVNYKALNDSDFKVAGEVNAYRLNLGTITGNDSLGLATLNANFTAAMVNGNFTADTAILTLKSLQYNKYNYENLVLNASFEDSLLYSSIWYEDDNLDFDIDIKANLNEGNSSLVMDGEIEEADLLKLNLSPDSIIISTGLSADIENLDPDRINGYFRLANTTLIEGPRKFELDTFQITALTEDTIRYFNLDSDFVDAELRGRFAFSDLPEMINDFTTHYFTTTRDTVDLPGAQYVVLEVAMKEEPMIVKAFFPDLDIPQASTIFAEYHADTRLVEVDIDIPALQYMEYRVQELNVVADTENEDNIKFAVTANQATLGEDLTIPQFGIEGSFIQDMLQFNVFIANSEEPSYLDLNGFLTNNEDTIIFELLESSLAIEQEQWNIPENAIIQYADSFLLVNNFVLTQDAQKISVSTENEYSQNPQLEILVADFQIGDVLAVLGMQEYEVEGKLNGTAEITNVFTLERVDADFGIKNLIVNAQEAGDLVLQAEKSASDPAVDLLVSMEGAQTDLSLEGTYNTEDTINTLDMELAIEKFRLEQWGVFVEEFVSELRGNIHADIDITGSVNQPVVEGYFAFDPKTVMRIKAIGSLYKFDDQKITLTENTIEMNDLTIRDSADHKLRIGGNISHEYFQDFVLDLDIVTEEFKFFNAKQRYSPEYYGTVNASTDISISGPVENLNVTGSVTTKEGTNLIIALLDNPDIATHATFVNFVNTNAYLAADSIPDSVQVASNTLEVTGISMNLTLNITPEATTQIIIDPMTGDKLVAVGEGEINVQMTSTGDMSIQGTYIIERGSYRLSFLNIVKKQFEIREGSTIDLAGDPLAAQFDIAAVYSTEADLGDILPEGDPYGVEQPINVVLNLEGTLESPDIGFKIEAPELNNELSMAAHRLKMIQDDEAQLYQQVFGLIVLNRLIPTDGGLGGGSGGGGAGLVNQRVDASVSSILTNQLGRLTEDYLGGVELSVDLESRDETFENKDVQVQLSKQLLNDRLTVTVGGTQSLGGQPATAGGESTPLMGDFEVLYRINESGTLNVRIFRTNDRDIYTQRIQERQGASLTYVKSFDEIFVSDDNKKVLRAE